MAERVRIALTGVSATGHHGVFDHERRDGQTFVVDVALEVMVDVDSDDLAGTVNYGEVAEGIVAVIEGEPVNLIETLAGRIADACLAFGPVLSAEVCVHKPQAPITVAFHDVTVTLTRTRAADEEEKTR